MSVEGLVFALTLVGGLLAVLSHGLGLLERLLRIRERRMEGAAPESADEAAASESVGRRAWLLRWGPAAFLLLVAAGSGLWMLRAAPPGAESATRIVLPDGPSVVVLPFRALGGGTDGSIFADGLTENVTSALAAVPGLLVIARHSVMPYKDKDPQLQQVAREQGVRHVVTGSVQWQEQRVRVTVQMSDASTGRQLWSERYDRTPANVLDVHDEIALRVATGLQAQLTEGDQARLRSSGTRNLDAWRLATRGMEAFLRYEPPANAEARRLFEEAVRLDPGYAWAWSMLGSARLIAGRFGFTDDAPTMLASADGALHKAIALDPQMAVAHGSLGMIHLARQQFSAAEIAGRKALELAPGSSELHALLAQTLFYRGKFAEAIEQSRQAVRLSPRHPSWYLIWESAGAIYLGRPQAGQDVALRMLAVAESPFQRAAAHVLVAFAHAEAGNLAAARGAIEEARRSDPKHDLGFYRRVWRFENPAQFERFVARLREAGLPD